MFPNSLPGEMLSLAISHCTILQSIETLDELAAVLSRQKFDRWVTREARASAFAAIASLSERIGNMPKVHICRDPGDNKYLELACGGHADFLVSGDEDLLTLVRISTTEIISAREFIMRLKV